MWRTCGLSHRSHRRIAAAEEDAGGTGVPSSLRFSHWIIVRNIGDRLTNDSRTNAKAKLPGPPATTLKLAKPAWRPRSPAVKGLKLRDAALELLQTFNLEPAL
jgi:hypothetical protein